MDKEIDVEKLINRLLTKISQLELVNAKLMILVEDYECKESKEEK
ncbi:hypothetical protein ikelab_21550 [Lactococcus garvieae]|uniref:Uncharacterized protein n=1 Tax=Lactococcus garvieae TaxID=1363 RepID=A0A6L2ZZ65_9LACT|nr:hypothetical protein [Lactococcus garvieae]GFO52880.1 hypothetical protein ikelab_21550 [Lactococcus garvieae]